MSELVVPSGGSFLPLDTAFFQTPSNPSISKDVPGDWHQYLPPDSWGKDPGINPAPNQKAPSFSIPWYLPGGDQSNAPWWWPGNTKLPDWATGATGEGSTGWNAGHHVVAYILIILAVVIGGILFVRGGGK